ncbi:MAG: GNAT family acetyltransferase [Planctomycetota bacterium]|jgi:ribosomal protein S18 acetylase RimI-like enzyme
MDTQELTIRKYKETDLKDVVDIWKRCNLVVPWNHPETDIKIKMDFQPDLFLVGEIDSRLVATVMAGFEGHRGWINYLAVLPEFRRQGIGRKLMEEAEKRLHKLNCPKINLQIRSSNKDVIDFYKSIGFSQDNVISLGKRLDGRIKE